MKKQVLLAGIIFLSFFLEAALSQELSVDQYFGPTQAAKKKLMAKTVFPRRFLCPYTGKLHNIKTAQLEHIIPLKWAWQHGAADWDQATRYRFANDPENLLLVYGPVKENKGDRDPGEWLPPNHDYIPIYVGRWKMICSKYALQCDYHVLYMTKSMYQP